MTPEPSGDGARSARRRLRSAVRARLAPLLGRLGWADNPLAGLLFDLFDRTYPIDGCTIEAPRDLTTRGFRARFFFRTYERNEIALVRELVRPDDAVLELGGGLGVVACVVGRRLARPERHVVVEARPDLVPWLERNRDRNGCRFRVEPGMVGTASGTDGGDGTATLYLHPLVIGASAVRRTGKAVEVPVRPLADVVRGLEPTVLLLDVEGAEAAFLAAHGELLRRLRLAIVELHPVILGEEGVDGCRRHLAAAGLRRVRRRAEVEAWERPA